MIPLLTPLPSPSPAPDRGAELPLDAGGQQTSFADILDVLVLGQTKRPAPLPNLEIEAPIEGKGLATEEGQVFENDAQPREQAVSNLGRAPAKASETDPIVNAGPQEIAPNSYAGSPFQKETVARLDKVQRVPVKAEHSEKRDVVLPTDLGLPLAAVVKRTANVEVVPSDLKNNHNLAKDAEVNPQEAYQLPPDQREPSNAIRAPIEEPSARIAAPTEQDATVRTIAAQYTIQPDPKSALLMGTPVHAKVETPPHTAFTQGEPKSPDMPRTPVIQGQTAAPADSKAPPVRSDLPQETPKARTLASTPTELLKTSSVGEAEAAPGAQTLASRDGLNTKLSATNAPLKNVASETSQPQMTRSLSSESLHSAQKSVLAVTNERSRSRPGPLAEKPAGPVHPSEGTWPLNTSTGGTANADARALSLVDQTSNFAAKIPKAWPTRDDARDAAKESTPTEVAKTKQTGPVTETAPPTLVWKSPPEARQRTIENNDIARLSPAQTALPVTSMQATPPTYAYLTPHAEPPLKTTPISLETPPLFEKADVFQRLEPSVTSFERAPPSSATTPSGPDQARHIAQQLATAVPTSLPGTTEITLQPEELGRVRMTFTVQDGAMTLVIQAERPDTTDLMRRHIDVLMQTYRQMGFDTLNLSFANSAHRQPANEIDRQVAAEAGETTDENLIETPIKTTRQPSTTADGRLDLRM